MELSKDNIDLTCNELIGLFDGGDDYDPNTDDEKTVKDLIIDMCGDLYDTDILTAESAWVINKIGVPIPSATLIDLGITSIDDYNFDIKSDIKEEIKKTEIIEEDISAIENDETYTENTDMVAISQIKFKEILKLLKPGIGTKNSMVNNATHVIFDHDTVMSFNGETTVFHPFITRVNGSVPYNYLVAIVGKFGPNDIIEISSSADILKLSSGKSEFTLILDCTSPPDFDIQALDWMELPTDFLTGLEVCHDSAHDSEDFGIISCIKFRMDSLVAFDNISAVKYIMEDSIPDTVFIPKKIAKLCYTKFEPNMVAVNESWILFKNNEGVAVGGQTMFGDYPTTKSFFKKPTAEVFKFNQKHFASLLERASIVADEDDNNNKKIEIELFPLKLTCRAGNGVGMFQEDLDINYTGEQMVFSVIPKTLINIIKNTDELFLTENTIGYETENVLGTVNIIK